jgi:hypothetical protein
MRAEKSDFVMLFDVIFDRERERAGNADECPKRK